MAKKSVKNWLSRARRIKRQHPINNTQTASTEDEPETFTVNVETSNEDVSAENKVPIDEIPGTTVSFVSMDT